ncbi:unnamed protein product [Periconia digitata]|uniref:Uncharacterized protein n=1 Tax=Periconia digitata TaxID=1303443 RepID=A0A9W4UT15_9PLEO|nr:unnamed protein product [Periconia digitata]
MTHNHSYHQGSEEAESQKGKKGTHSPCFPFPEKALSRIPKKQGPNIGVVSSSDFACSLYIKQLLRRSYSGKSTTANVSRHSHLASINRIHRIDPSDSHASPDGGILRPWKKLQKRKIIEEHQSACMKSGISDPCHPPAPLVRTEPSVPENPSPQCQHPCPYRKITIDITKSRKPALHRPCYSESSQPAAEPTQDGFHACTQSSMGGI